ncbi:MAG: sterol desaturase family protein [Myxococcales bacterium]|nr:sterol desaturase family protein [Myxococcales bacterium]
MSVLIYAAIPIFLVTLLIELAWARRRTDDARIVGYATKDTLASLGMGVGNVIIAAFTKLVSLALMIWLYQYRVATLPNVWWTWVLLFFAEDLCYYAFHRASHEIRFLWAAHVNHHSSQHYNLSTALRQSWTTPLTGPLFWLPLPLLGFAPWMVLVQQAISLLYQYWIHTEAIAKLPAPIEFIFNTPSHHRVHHGANPEYLDRNHGGILIIWDRLFGTFEPERARVVYGLTENIKSFKLHVIAFHEWIAMARDARRAPTLRAALGYLFRPPGWRHDGRGKTAAEVLADSQDPATRAPLPGV